AISGGNPIFVTGSTDLGDPAVNPSDGSIAAMEDTGNAAGDVNLVVLSNGAKSAAITSAAGQYFSPSWSADGPRIVYIQETSPNTSWDKAELWLAPNSSGWSTASIVPTSGNWYDDNPIFHADGSIWFNRWDDTSTSTPPEDLWKAAFVSSSWTVTD